ncbi:amidohydrolase family protein [Uruburuella testudinis]|uniref:Amidohydrolase family protein n=1 Tax=Uruburuella testudinis TaxID=1282863 RepID=A0ABY4DPX6_9NEIS|nr:amidohydrolase family protein [Uruburuella testudinis]UOO81085.1 amidohydrolase family protein [Uruburuella testudinis]
MKIICIEEHLNTPALAAATLPAMQAEAAPMFGWGSRIDDGTVPLQKGRAGIASPKLIPGMTIDVGAGRLAQMDEHGIDMQILSYGGAPQLAAASQAAGLMRTANQHLADAVSRHPDRFAGLATLPWQTPEAVAGELEHAVTQLGLRGALINGRPSENFLDHPRYDEALAAFAELGVPLYVHPGLTAAPVQQAYYAGFDAEIDARLGYFAWGWHHEAGVQVVRMMVGGVFDRHPKLQIISGHWGEMVPFYLSRLDVALPPEVTGLSRSLSQTYREHVYVTPSGMLEPAMLAFVRDTVGAERLIFSMDYPYQTLENGRSFVEQADLNETQRQAFAHGNAEKLFALGD